MDTENIDTKCGFCDSLETGPGFGTPYGICRDCACPTCKGFRWFDDRGFLLIDQPFLTKKNCSVCQGTGRRVIPQAPKIKVLTLNPQASETGKSFAYTNVSNQAAPMNLTFYLQAGQGFDIVFRKA